MISHIQKDYKTKKNSIREQSCQNNSTKLHPSKDFRNELKQKSFQLLLGLKAFTLRNFCVGEFCSSGSAFQKVPRLSLVSWEEELIDPRQGSDSLPRSRIGVERWDRSDGAAC